MLGFICSHVSSLLAIHKSSIGSLLALVSTTYYVKYLGNVAPEKLPSDACKNYDQSGEWAKMVKLPQNQNKLNVTLLCKPI